MMYLVSHYAGGQMDGLEQMRILSLSLVRIIGSLGGVASKSQFRSFQAETSSPYKRAGHFIFGGFV